MLKKICTASYLSLVITFSLVQAQTPSDPQPPTEPSYAEQNMEALELTSYDAGETLLYRQYSPPTVEAGQSYPLVVFLHGYGERGSDNSKQLVHCADSIIRYIEKNKPAYLIMPQCPDDMRWVRYQRPVNQPPHRMDRYPTLPLQLVEKLIENKINDLPIDPKRIYIAGLSMGGFATWDLISRRPELYAAALPICGGGDPAQAEAASQVPVWTFHGGADSVVPLAYSQLMVDALKAQGKAEAKLTVYPEVGHDSWTQTANNPDVWKWLFSQSKE